jgi:hypothetical protein
MRREFEHPRRWSMNCYECAKQAHDVPAVAVCRGCGAGLCVHHLHNAATLNQGGPNFGCDHDTWSPSEARAALAAEERWFGVM